MVTQQRPPIAMTEIEPQGKVVGTATQLIAGAISGVAADLATHPLSTVKTRLQVQGATKSYAGGSNTVIYRGPISAFGTILRNEGIMSLYKGAGIVAAGAAPSQALYFAGYETVKTIW